MHALLAHATHLALMPHWRPLGVALAVAFGVRFAGRSAAMVAAISVLAGWTTQYFALLTGFAPPAGARLPGLAAILMIDAVFRQRARAAPGWWLLPATAALAGWWVRGAPLTGPGLVNGMPAFLGFLAALPLARRLARGDPGWASIAAAIGLAGGLWVTCAPPHYQRAALLPACAALALLGRAEAGAALAPAIVVAAGATIVTTEHGRFTPIDAACLTPLLVWALAPALAQGVARSVDAVAGLLAVALCVGLAWAAETALK